MMRLVRHGLMYGNLLEVDTPALVERYNAALVKLTGRETALKSFRIDLSGFAPEIGEEFEDPLYLNPNGCNRQFILLSTAQKSAPLLNAYFSTSRSILRRFITENADALFSLTARDAVIGEIENSIHRVVDVNDVLQIRHVGIDADTTTGLVADGRRLEQLVGRFNVEEDAWWDEELIDGMIGIARRTGNIVRNPSNLDRFEYDQGNFYTKHFGGLYVFHDVPHPGVVSVDPTAAGPAAEEHGFIDLADSSAITAFLSSNNLVEDVFSSEDLDAEALLRQRQDFILIDHMSHQGHDLGGVTRQDLRVALRSSIDDLPDVFHQLSDMTRWLKQGGDKPQLSPSDAAYFYTFRARPHGDRDLVNMLLAELMPHDIRHVFICHKAAFYDAYAEWSDAKREYVADFLAREYAIDKAGTRVALFGPEPSMAVDLGSGDGNDGIKRGVTAPINPVAAKETVMGPWGPREGV